IIRSRRPYRPVHEIGARIVRIAVVVEEIADGKAADDERDPVDVTLARELIGSVLNLFLLATETESLFQIIALGAISRLGGARLLRLAVGKAGDAQRAADAES